MFSSKIQGIPCKIDVTHYSSGTNYPINACSPEPNDDPEFEYDVYDLKGYHAPWLEKKITNDDAIRIWRDFLDWCEPDYDDLSNYDDLY